MGKQWCKDSHWPLPRADRCPDSFQAGTSLEKVSSPPLPFLLLSVRLYSMEYPFGQIGSAFLAVSPSSFLSTLNLQLCGGIMRKRGRVILWKPCSAAVKTLVRSQHCFGHKSKTALWVLLWRRQTPFQVDPIQRLIGFRAGYKEKQVCN